MKTSEFIKKVEKLGYSIFKGSSVLYIRANDLTLGLVSLEKMYYMDLETELKELFDLCVEYAQTPLTEREEEQKFYLQKIKSFYEIRLDEEFDFLNFDITRQVYCLNNTMGNSKFKTSFTQQEIDKIKEEQHTDLSEFKQIPVEEIEACTE